MSVITPGQPVIALSLRPELAEVADRLANVRTLGPSRTIEIIAEECYRGDVAAVGVGELVALSDHLRGIR